MRRGGGEAIGLLGGALLDAQLGDPPNRRHPVAALGRVVRLAEAYAPTEAPARRWYGAVVAMVAPAACALAALGLTRVGGRAPGGRLAVECGLLALATSQRTLFDRAAEVAVALEANDLVAARRLVGMHLVSRDTTDLDEAGVAAAAIESVAENLSDGVIAAWSWFAVAGAPGAWAYRAANTLDAMWGYRTPAYEDLGRAAARLDDALNVVPARVTALAILVAAGGRGARTWWRDRGLTASPNAGHPMAAMAGALGVRLAKDGEYVLGADGDAPAAGDVRRASALARRAAWLALALLAPLAAWRGRR